MDQNFFNWIRNFRPLGDSLSVASLPDSFLVKIERRVGRILRNRTLPDSLQLEVRLSLGDVTRDGFRDAVPDTSRFYWGLRYGFYNKNRQDGGGDEGSSLSKTTEISSEFNDQLFLADYKTGEEVAVTDVKQNNNSIPHEYLLEQNYPNPFNPSTKIRYSIPSFEFVTLKIYNILGSEVATLVNQKQTSGSYEVSFNATDLTSGIYFYQISTSNFTQVNKMMLLK
ncbi:MAG: T9SS type A sorting domain-containing protein [Ignavibacteriae bacterium]|nr:T9SS type A sorting domain-containing protein [Ignavibacteriota bacterium]